MLRKSKYYSMIFGLLAFALPQYGSAEMIRGPVYDFAMSCGCKEYETVEMTECYKNIIFEGGCWPDVRSFVDRTCYTDSNDHCFHEGFLLLPYAALENLAVRKIGLMFQGDDTNEDCSVTSVAFGRLEGSEYKSDCSNFTPLVTLSPNVYRWSTHLAAGEVRIFSPKVEYTASSTHCQLKLQGCVHWAPKSASKTKYIESVLVF